MKRFVIGTNDSIFRLSAEVVCIDDFDKVAFITNHQTIAEFKEWDYWYEETCEKEKEACCPCK